MRITQRVNLFLGAGASSYFDFPTTKSFIDDFRQKLEKGFESEILDDILKIQGFLDVEHVLELLDKLETLRGRPVEDLFRTFNAFLNLPNRGGYNFVEFMNVASRLRDKLIDDVYRQYEFDDGKIEQVSKAYNPLLTSVFNLTRSQELSIFTTNYDRVVENLCYDKDNTTLIDGFVRNRNMKLTPEEFGWDSEQFNKDFESDIKTGNTVIKLYKLHGSLNWRIRKIDDQIVRIASEQRIKESKRYKKNLVVYPAEKFKPESDPFRSLHEFFAKEFVETDITIFIGFAFRDEYLNDVMKRSSEKKKVLIVSPIANELIKVTLNKASGFKFTPYAVNGLFGKHETLQQIEETLSRIL